MSKLVKSALINEILIPLIGLCVTLSLFLSQPDVNKTLWLRRFFIYVAGGLSLLALIYMSKQIKLIKRASLILELLTAISTISLFMSKPLVWGIIGQPIIHPGLLSLYASILIGLVFAVSPDKKNIYKGFYALLVVFTVINLVYWLTHGLDSRLGFLGVQLNYTAYLTVIGLIIGIWAYSNRIFPIYLIYLSQLTLLVSALLTQSRVAILLALASFILFVYILVKDHYKVTALLALTILISLLAVVRCSSSFDRVHNQSYLNTSVTYRLDLIKASIPVHLNKLILGGGVGSLEHNIGTNGQNYTPIKKDLKAGWKFESSHNYVVDILVERGVVVLILYIAFITYALKQGLRSSNNEQKLLLFLLLATLIFWFFNNINIQAELIMWGSIIGLLTRTSHKDLSTSKLKIT